MIMKIATHVCTFDETDHIYRIDGVPVPSVTQIIRAAMPGWEAGEWYLGRGRAVHAHAALIALGVGFEAPDPRIAGQVAACRRFFREVRPTVVAVEQQVYHVSLRYGGTFDLHCEIGGMPVLVDYKASRDTERTRIQLGGYALAMDPGGPRWGFEVVLHASGRYSMSERIDLRAGRRKFAALVNAPLHLQGGATAEPCKSESGCSQFQKEEA
jgi:hypothetical protein